MCLAANIRIVGSHIICGPSRRNLSLSPKILPTLSCMHKVDMSSTTINPAWSTGMAGRVVICAGTRDPHRPGAASMPSNECGGAPTLLGLGDTTRVLPTHPLFRPFEGCHRSAPTLDEKVRIAKVVTKPLTQVTFYFPHLPDMIPPYQSKQPTPRFDADWRWG